MNLLFFWSIFCNTDGRVGLNTGRVVILSVLLKEASVDHKVTSSAVANSRVLSSELSAKAASEAGWWLSSVAWVGGAKEFSWTDSLNTFEFLFIWSMWDKGVVVQEEGCVLRSIVGSVLELFSTIFGKRSWDISKSPLTVRLSLPFE